MYDKPRTLTWARMRRTVAVGVIILLAFACSDSTGPKPGPQPQVGVSIVGNTTGLEVGDSTQLSAMVTGNNQNPSTVTANSWTSSDTSTAVVTTSGLVVTKRVGGTTITAVVGQTTGSVNIAVDAVKPFFLNLVLGGNQEGRAGEDLVTPIVVRVLGKRGTPLSDTEVRWEASAAGSPASGTSLTDAAGQSAMIWTLGGTAGSQSLQVSAGARQTVVLANAIAAPVTTVSVVRFDRRIPGIAATGRLTIGAQTAEIDSDSSGSIRHDTSIPALITLSGSDGGVFLLGIASGGGSAERRLDATSTAKALLFFCPSLATGEEHQATEVLAWLERAPGFAALVAAIEVQRNRNPSEVLDFGDNAIITAASTVIRSFTSSTLAASAPLSLAMRRPAARRLEVPPQRPRGAVVLRRRVRAGGPRLSAGSTADAVYRLDSGNPVIGENLDGKVTIVGHSQSGTIVEVENVGIPGSFGKVNDRPLRAAVHYYSPVDQRWILDQVQSGHWLNPTHRTILRRKGDRVQLILTGGNPARITLYGLAIGHAVAGIEDRQYTAMPASIMYVTQVGLPILTGLLNFRIIDLGSEESREFIGYFAEVFLADLANRLAMEEVEVVALLDDPPASARSAIAKSMGRAAIATGLAKVDILAAWTGVTNASVLATLGRAAPWMSKAEAAWELFNTAQVLAAGIPANPFNFYCPACEQSAPTTGTVGGLVTCSGRSVAGARIDIGSATATTGIEGQYSITGLRAGPQTVVLQSPAQWRCSWQTPQSITVQAGATTNVDFRVDTVPVLTGTSPGEVASSIDARTLRVLGRGFNQNTRIVLRSTVRTLTFVHQQFVAFSPSDISVSVALDPGTWTVQAFNGQNAGSNTLVVTVASAPSSPLVITTTALNPSTATIGVGYAAQEAVAATGGTPPYTWSASGLPGGLSINSSNGAIFGTPTAAGVFNFTVTVRDVSGPQKTASKSLSLTVNAAAAPLVITTMALNPSTATVGVGYAAQEAVAATGGTPPYTWSASGLPGGLSINSSNGAIFGTPTAAGVFNFTVTVRDVSSPQKTASKSLSLTVNAAAAPLVITTTALNPPTATVGVGYAAQEAVAATGGTTPYTWSASGLPSGLSINSSNGAIFGTPTAAGAFNFTVTVRDVSSPQKTASKSLSLTVNAAASPLVITTTALKPPTATVGVGYAAQEAVAATGGTTPYTWSASGLPSGLSINSSNGAIFGTPTAAGTFNFTVTVRDASSPQKTTSKNLSLTVH
jgi:hypothetical protein